MWQCIVSAPGSLAILDGEATEPLPALHDKQAPTVSLSPEREWFYPLGVRLRSHLLLQELPGLYTQDTHTSEGAALFRVVPALNVGYRARTK